MSFQLRLVLINLICYLASAGSIFSLDGSECICESGAVDLKQFEPLLQNSAHVSENLTSAYSTSITIKTYTNFAPDAALKSIALGKSVAEKCIQAGGDVVLQKVKEEKSLSSSS